MIALQKSYASWIRIRDYRVICNIEADRLVVLVLRTGHRKDVYG